MADKTTGLTADEAQEALGAGVDINQVCRAYNSREGTVRVLYDLPTGEEVRRDLSMKREEPEASADNAIAEGDEAPSDGEEA